MIYIYKSDINDLLAMKLMDQTLDLRGGKTPQAKAKASETSPCPQENQAKKWQSNLAGCNPSQFFFRYDLNEIRCGIL